MLGKLVLYVVETSFGGGCADKNGQPSNNWGEWAHFSDLEEASTAADLIGGSVIEATTATKAYETYHNQEEESESGGFWGSWNW